MVNLFKFLSKRSLPKKGDKDYRSLRDYSNEELHGVLERNEETDFRILAAVCSEILRRCKIRYE